MNITKFPLTSDQKLLLNSLISLLASAVSAGLLAMYQYYGSNNVINIGAIIIIGLTVFGVSFGHGLYAYIPGHIAEEMQGLKDTVKDIQDATTTPVAASVVPSSPLVVIHTTAIPSVPTGTSVTTPETPIDVATTQANINTAGSVIPADVVPVATGVTTQEDANQKTVKIAAVTVK